MKIVRKIPGLFWIAITGGPCGGKSTLMQKAKKELEARGFAVFILSELATMIHTWGIKLPLFNTQPAYQILLQHSVLAGQYKNEEILARLIIAQMEILQTKKAVVLCDRGMVDGRAYTGGNIFDWILADEGLNLGALHHLYDGVIHLITAADGAERFFSCDNNDARSEDITGSRQLDKNIQEAWTGHEYLHIIPNRIESTAISFDEKIQRAIQAICSIVGEPQPIENEKKFQILKPVSINTLPVSRIVTTKIEQMYLHRLDKNIERRIRVEVPVTLDHSNIMYYYTEKTKIPNSDARIEENHPISEMDYLRLAHDRDLDSVPIFKNRNYFVNDSIYWMLDDIEEPVSGIQFIEHEFYNMTDSVVLTPEFLGACRDVTGVISNRDIAFKRYAKLAV